MYVKPLRPTFAAHYLDPGTLVLLILRLLCYAKNPYDGNLKYVVC